jgi:homoserine O-acetyltransferase
MQRQGKPTSIPSRAADNVRCSLWGRLALLALLLPAAMPAQSGLQFADLGACSLESGQAIQDCRIAYRTFGQLRGRGENAVLFPTWFSGSSADLEQFIGADRMLDPARYYVILVDAFGNGRSSSPSNSKTQAGAAFPKFSIRDLVRSQHRLLTEVLGIERLRAVMGISMGGMQTFEWMVSYPQFVERAIPIIGSPQLAPYDLLLWNSELNAIEEATKAHTDAAEARRAGMRIAAGFQMLALTSPAHFNSTQTRQGLEASMAQEERRLIDGYNPYDWASQLRTMIGHDITGGFGGSWEKTAAAVRAKTLVISAIHDHMVTPEPSFEFARRIGAEVLRLEAVCGHLAPGCEQERVNAAIRSFLEN